MIVIWLALTLSPAAAQAPAPGLPGVEPCPVVQPSPERPFRDEYGQARELFTDGCYPEALVLFESLDRRLDGGEIATVDLRIAAKTGIYIGVIRFHLGEPLAASRAFGKVLLRDPDQGIDVMEHDPDAVRLFESVRLEVKAELARTKPPPRLPAWGLLPLGVPQFRTGRPAAGVTFALAQAALGTASAILAVRLYGSPERRTSLNIALSTAASTGFYAVWLGSWAEARGHWRKVHATTPRVAVVPTPRGAQMVVFGRF